LETAIANLQMGTLAPRVHAILDQHRAEMPPVKEQDEDDRIWRLAMHRMDLRQYTIAKDVTEEPVAPEGHTSTEDGRQYVRLDPKLPEPDVKEMVDQSAARLQAVTARQGLLMWGLKVFGNEEGTTYDPAQWRPRLQEAQAAGLWDGNGEEHNWNRGGPGFIATVCIRDHWEEMSSDERDWCVDVVCLEVEREGDNWNQLARVQQFSISDDRPCAWVVPLLLGKSLSEVQQARVRQILAVALTHAIDEVRLYAALGIGRNLWVIDRNLTLRCVNALATEATLIQHAFDTEKRRPYKDRRQLDKIEEETAALVRRQFFEGDAIAEDAYQAMDQTMWFGAEANKRILAILGQAPTEAVAIAAFQRLVTTLVGWWDAEDGRRRGRQQERPERNYQTESVLTDLLENFLLRTTTAHATTIITPIVDATDRHPDKVHWILIGLISVEDRQPNTPQFWSLWSLFANRLQRATWLSEIDSEHARGTEMMSAVFLGSWWKEEARHWRSLEGHAGHIHALFDDLPPSSTVLDCYLRFLYYIGEQSLPGAFICIAKRLQQGNPRQMMKKGNTVFMLETLLQRYVYGRPLELKHQSNLRDAILVLLDLLVENGSSAAFRMRDDFVTPISIV
jgi:hypothetical protein